MVPHHRNSSSLCPPACPSANPSTWSGECQGELWNLRNARCVYCKARRHSRRRHLERHLERNLLAVLGSGEEAQRHVELLQQQRACSATLALQLAVVACVLQRARTHRAGAWCVAP